MTPAGVVLKRLAAMLLALCIPMAAMAAAPVPLLKATTWFPAHCRAWVFKSPAFKAYNKACFGADYLGARSSPPLYGSRNSCKSTSCAALYALVGQDCISELAGASGAASKNPLWTQWADSWGMTVYHTYSKNCKGVITCYDGFAAPKSACPDLPFYGLLKKSGHLFDPITGRPVNPATGFPSPKAVAKTVAAKSR